MLGRTTSGSRRVPLGQKDEEPDCPDAEHEAEDRPQAYRVAVVAGEETAHDRVAGIDDGTGCEEGWEVEMMRRDQAEASQIAEHEFREIHERA